MTPADVEHLDDIDATFDAADYLHLDASGEGLAIAWKVEQRKLRERKIEAFALDDDLQFAFKQVATGIEDGLALVAEHDGAPIAALLARRNEADGLFDLLDVRVDSDYRRQGLAMAMLFKLIADARDAECRAVRAHTLTNNARAAQLLAKCGFELSGVDTRRRSNHDLVKEAATLIWYMPLN